MVHLFHPRTIKKVAFFIAHLIVENMHFDENSSKMHFWLLKCAIKTATIFMVRELAITSLSDINNKKYMSKKKFSMIFEYCRHLLLIEWGILQAFGAFILPHINTFLKWLRWAVRPPHTLIFFHCFEFFLLSDFFKYYFKALPLILGGTFVYFAMDQFKFE